MTDKPRFVGGEPDPERLAKIREQAPLIVEQMHEMLTNAGAIHGPLFAEYMAYHVKVHQFKLVFTAMLESARAMSCADNQKVALHALTSFTTANMALVELVSSMDDHVASMCSITPELAEEAAKLGKAIAKIGTVHFPK